MTARRWCCGPRRASEAVATSVSGTRIGQAREASASVPPPRRNGKLSLDALYSSAELSGFRAQPKWRSET